MASWAALNVDAPRIAEETRDYATEEALEAHNGALYERALRLQQRSDGISDAKTIYTDLLEAATGLSPRLRYLCAKNLATLEAERHSYEAALQRFSQALALDDSDVLVWFQMGKAAMETGQLWLARRAFEGGFHADATFWPLVQALRDVLDAVGDVDAYRRMNSYFIEQDPYAVGTSGGYSLDLEDGIGVEPTQSGSVKRRTRALECSLVATKRRKTLEHQIAQRAQELAARAPIAYVLQHKSWHSLGKLLLEAYEDVMTEETTDGAANTVFVSVNFADEPPKPPTPTSPTAPTVTHPVVVSEKEADAASLPPARGDTEVLIDLSQPATGGDSVTKGSANEPIEVEDDTARSTRNAPQSMNRRKSRRHEEKLREEHEIAAKLAREKNLAFRLQAFVPTTNSDARQTHQQESIVFSVKNGAVILLTASGGEEVHVFENVLPRADAVVEVASDNHDDQMDDESSSIGRVQSRDISTFVTKTIGGDSQTGSGIVQMLRKFLNQCGEWASRELRGEMDKDDECIHPVCLWAEKVVCGQLGAPEPATEAKAPSTRVAVHRVANGGLTLETRLFLLELHLDELLRHQQQEMRRNQKRKPRRARLERLDGLHSAAQCLLLEICLHDSENENDSNDGNAPRALSRLFWLCGQICEHRSDVNAAQDYLSRCKAELEQLPSDTVILRPNLRLHREISASIVDEKMVMLQSFGEAKEITGPVELDDTQAKLLMQFFPTDGQCARIHDLLGDLAASKTRGGGDNAGGGDAERDGSILETLLQSIVQCSQLTRSVKILRVLTVLHELQSVLNVTRVKAVACSTSAHDGESEGQADNKESKVLALATQAIEHTADHLLKIVLSEDGVDHPIDQRTSQAVVAVVVRVLEPTTLLLFESPRKIFQMICEVSHRLSSPSAGDATERRADSAFLLAVFKSYRGIRSLAPADFDRVTALLPASSSGNKSKKKQVSRRDHGRRYLQSALAYMVKNVELLVQMLPSSEVTAFMEDCCVMLKEEEDAVSHRRNDSDKIAKGIFATGAFLFLHVFVRVATQRKDENVSLKDLDALVSLLHDRLGRHELCSYQCYDIAETSSKTGGRGGSFVEAAAKYLSHRRGENEGMGHGNSTRESTTTEENRKSESVEGDPDGRDNEDDCRGDFDVALSQCFRCLYDVHIVPGCADHKTGKSIKDLDDASVENASQLAQFAIPMMLKNPPKSNAQKKENLKILFAIRRAIELDDALQQAPVIPSPELLEYMAPHQLLGRDASSIPPTAPSRNDNEATANDGNGCLENVWFLLGENFILNRVRRRSNLSELIEMERKVKERVAYFVKDVLYYHPRRIKSWVRLGRAMKELYHLASDVCALMIGRRQRQEALLAYVAANSSQTDTLLGESADVLLSFRHVVLDTSLFEKMKKWRELDSVDARKSHRFDIAGEMEGEIKRRDDEPMGAGEEHDTTNTRGYRLEEYALLYMVQVAEFSRRCFDMAVSLAQACKESDAKESPTVDGDEAPLMDTSVECSEECGLLMYTLLQEFTSLRKPAAVGTSNGVFTEINKCGVDFYGNILDAAYTYFQDGLRVSNESNPDAQDVRFRLHYMIGKVLKKKRWFQQFNQNDAATNGQPTTPQLQLLSSTAEIMACFASAEQAHEDGKMEKAIVHAFYQLQARRLELVLSEPATVEKLTLACEHYFEEDVEEEDEEDEEEEKEESKDGDENMEDDSTKKVGKEDVATILRLATADSSIKGEYTNLLQLAQAWLFLNVIEALESISDEDRYFHASRYAIAKAMYHFDSNLQRLAALHESWALPVFGHVVAATPSACITALQELKKKQKNDGSMPAETALKAMGVLFDKKRPQVVAIWLSEHVPSPKKFEELNQRQSKYDFCRLKYWKYYVSLLQESLAYTRLKEISSWVLTCKEEHDVMDEMLGIVLYARGVVQLSRLRDFVSVQLVDQLQRYQQKRQEESSGSAMMTTTMSTVASIDLSQEDKEEVDDPGQSLLKELGKAYVNYLDVADARVKLAEVMESKVVQELVLLAEFPLVCLFLVGLTEFTGTFDVAGRDEATMASYIADVTPKLRSMLVDEHETSTIATDAFSLAAASSVDWTPLLDAARLFCENRWPERHSSSTTSKSGAKATARKARPAKVAVAAADAVLTNTTTNTADTDTSTNENDLFSTSIATDTGPAEQDKKEERPPSPANSMNLPVEI